jgi:hypothetical protein
MMDRPVIPWQNKGITERVRDHTGIPERIVDYPDKPERKRDHPCITGNMRDHHNVWNVWKIILYGWEVVIIMYGRTDRPFFNELCSERIISREVNSFDEIGTREITFLACGK